MNRRVYTDARVFDVEMRRVFGRTWVFVAHEDMLRGPGSFVTTSVGTTPVIVTVDGDGRLHVLVNRCAHRGSVVCREAAGTAKSFRCPYHGWIYAADGRLTGVAQRNGYPEELAEWGLGLAAARVASYRGLVFACFDPGAEPLEERLRAVRPYIDMWYERAPTGRVAFPAGAHRYEYPGNWKLQCENGVDGYHGNYVHESFAKLLHRSGERTEHDVSRTRNALGGRNHAKGLPHGDGLLEREDGMLGTFDYGSADAYRQELAARYGEQRTSDILVQRNIFVYPNLFLFESHIRVVRPVAVDRTYVDVHPTELVGAGADLNRDRLREHERFFGPASFGAPDDIDVFVRVQAGLRGGGPDWLEFSRGMHREELNDEGERVGHSTDEAPQRSQYRRWLELMRKGSDAVE
ncbi:MAG TPA: Rieske 2Fe-2S domain-containing protein [Acidimicrobiales bacterium]|nr:Rieske 2Fe-2S domain-containing protein [Acidimicrobiales bacterium]